MIIWYILFVLVSPFLGVMFAMITWFLILQPLGEWLEHRNHHATLITSADLRKRKKK